MKKFNVNDIKHIKLYVLAATLSSNIGIYGPVFEFMKSEALIGREEYLNSEKFQVTHYDWNIENKLIAVITKINHIRQQHEALQQTNNIKFCYIENHNLIAFYKWNDSKTSEILVVISLDDHSLQQGMVQLPLSDLGINNGHPLEITDLITTNSYTWNKEWNFVELHPTLPFHIFKIHK